MQTQVFSSANAVRLQLHVLAYNLGNFMRTLAMPKTAKPWSADQPAREADQDRRQGCQPRPLRHIPNCRGRGAAPDVPGNPVDDSPVAGAARTSMTRGSGQMRQTTAAEVRLDHGEAACSSATRPSVLPSWLSTGRLGRISLRRNARGRKIASNEPGIRRMSDDYTTNC